VWSLAPRARPDLGERGVGQLASEVHRDRPGEGCLGAVPSPHVTELDAEELGDLPLDVLDKGPLWADPPARSGRDSVEERGHRDGMIPMGPEARADLRGSLPGVAARLPVQNEGQVERTARSNAFSVPPFVPIRDRSQRAFCGSQGRR
jgi:hypothetical protein